jgi:branched-chain amino acid transport system substrate-binding protein
MTKGSTDQKLMENGVPRRLFLKGSLATALAAGAGLKAPAVLAQANAPIKVGVLLSLSKAVGQLGQSNINGMQLKFEQIGWTAGGRKIELIREDDEMNPQVGLQKLKKLIESDQVDILCGPQQSNVAMAMVGYMKQSKTLWLCSGAGATQVTWERIPTMFRTSCSVWQHSAGFSDWFYNNLAKETALMAADYTGGRDTVGEFKLAFSKAGGKIVKEIYPPLNTNDYSAYLLDLKSIGAPATFNFFGGTDAVRFVKQYEEFGLKEKTRLTGSGFLVEDTLPAQGKSALGIVNSLHYADTLDTPENRMFVADYRGKFTDYPSAYADYGYVTAEVIARALDAVGGDVSDREKFAAAIAGVNFSAPRGPFRFDPVTHNPIQNVYIREVAEIDGRIANKIIATIRDVQDPGVKPS